MSSAAANSIPQANEHRLAPDTLAASVLVLLVVSVLQRSVGFGRGVLFCRWLSPDELGQWDMAYSFLLLASPLIVLGLPGSFGRYLERYRQRQQLRIFLRRTAAWTAAFTAAAIGIIALWTPSFSWLVFGRPDRKSLVMLMAGSLVAVILHHFLEALFAALRKFRIVSTMQFCQSICFAVISLSLLWWWRLSAESIIIGYGAACFISAVGALVVTGRSIAQVAAPGPDVAHRVFWPPMQSRPIPVSATSPRLPTPCSRTSPAIPIWRKTGATVTTTNMTLPKRPSALPRHNWCSAPARPFPGPPSNTR